MIDFGIVKIVGADPLTGKARIGVLHYLAPEMVLSADFDARSDLYMVGTLVYQMLTGKTPFEDYPSAGPDKGAALLRAIAFDPPPPIQLPEGKTMNPHLRSLIMRALAKNPDERPQTAAEFLAELDRAWMIEGMPRTGPMPGRS